MATSLSSTVQRSQNVRRIAIAQPKETTTSGKIDNTGLFRILIVVAEVGISLLIPPAGGFALAAQVGIGLAAAGANLGLDIANDTISGINIGIDFGTAFIPAITAGVSATRTTKAINGAEGRIADALDAVKEGGIAASNRAGDKQIRNAIKARKRYQKAVNMAKDLASGNVNNLDMAVLDIATASKMTISNKTLNGRRALSELEYQKELTKILKKYKVSLQSVDTKVKELRKTFDEIKDFTFTQKTSRKHFFKEIDKLNSGQKKDFFKAVYFPHKKASQSSQLSRIAIAELTSELSEEGAELINAAQRNIKFFVSSGGEVDSLISNIVNALSDSDKAVVFSSGIADDLANTFTRAAATGGDTTIRKAIKSVGSQRFYRKVVRNTALIDPNDLGRFVPEQIYWVLRNKITGTKLRTAQKQALKGAGVGLKKARTVERALTEAGGVIDFTGRSTYLSRIRILPFFNEGTVASAPKLALMSFVEGNTNNKLPVLIQVNDEDIDMFRDSNRPSEWWFGKGRAKGWFISKGGKRIKTKAESVSREMSLFLGLVPIPALRNVLSIASNWVGQTSRIAKGQYFDNYWNKVTRPFLRTSITRSSRLLSRYLIGGAASKIAGSKYNGQVEALKIERGFGETGKALVNPVITSQIRNLNTSKRLAGQWVGRELQRFGTAFTSTITGQTSDGGFRFNTNNFGSRLTTKIQQGAAASARGLASRSGRRTGRNAGRQLVNTKRYLGQLRRVHSAFTPPGTPSLTKITKIKRRI